MRKPWDKYKIELLTQLWNDDKHSASMIADALGNEFSRNSIIGKANRLNLLPKRQRNKTYYGWKYTPRKPKPKEEDVSTNMTPAIVGAYNRINHVEVTLPTAPIEALPEAVSVVIPSSNGKGLGFFEAGPLHCRAIVEEGDSIYDLRFCAKPITEGCSYCQGHARQYYVRGRNDPRPTSPTLR